MKPHRLFALLAALAMTLMFAATAFAGTVTWTGQGVTDGELNNVDCEASETGFGLFIYTGDSDTAPVLTIDGVPYTGVQQGQRLVALRGDRSGRQLRSTPRRAHG